MNVLERIQRAEVERRPDNLVPFNQVERRAKARWVERKEQMGLPVQDSTSRIFDGPDAA